MPPLLCSPEDPLVSDWCFLCVCVCVFLFCLAVCSDPINSWTLTHIVNKHGEPSKFVAIQSLVVFAPWPCNTFKYAKC